MSFIIKNILGQWWATSKFFTQGKPVWIERSALSDEGKPQTRWIERIYVGSFHRKTKEGALLPDGERIRLVDSRIFNKTNNIAELAFMSYSYHPRACYTPEKELPDHITWIDGEELSEDELEAKLTPYPPIILQLVEIMEKYGEKWVDDCRENHLDDFKPYEAAEDILQALKNHKINLVTQELIPYEH